MFAVTKSWYQLALGFTGTRFGMTPTQREAFRVELAAHRLRGFDRFDHGDCVGADAEAHDDAADLGFRIHVHPPEKTAHRAFCEPFAIRFPPASYLKRNEAIVAAASALIATPRSREDDPTQRRSGTWATVRRARKKGIPIVIVWPSGAVTREAGRHPQRLELA